MVPFTSAALALAVALAAASAEGQYARGSMVRSRMRAPRCAPRLVVRRLRRLMAPHPPLTRPSPPHPPFTPPPPHTLAPSTPHVCDLRRLLDANAQCNPPMHACGPCMHVCDQLEPRPTPPEMQATPAHATQERTCTGAPTATRRWGTSFGGGHRSSVSPLNGACGLLHA